MKISFLTWLISLIGLETMAQIPTQGLVGWWPFTGNAIDSVKQNNNSQVYGATLTADRFGNSNSAYYFDGINDYMDVGTHSSLRGSSHSINFWFKYSDTSKNMYLVSNFNSLSGEWGSVAYFNTTNGLSHTIGSGPKDKAMGHLGRKSSADNSWHMYTATYNKLNNSLVVFVDDKLWGGVNYVSANGSFTFTDSVEYKSGEHWIFGASSQYFSSTNNNGPFWYKGYLDDVRIYNRSLTAVEVMRLYSGGTACYDTSFMDTIEVKIYDTIAVYDTTIILQYDTIYVHDTIRVHLFDTTFINIYDTTYITVYDTTFVSVSVTDTLILNVAWSSVNTNFNRAKVYPNPTRDKVTIDLGDYLKLNGHRVIVNSSTGQKLYDQAVTSRFMEIDLNGLAGPGTYVMLFADKTGYIVGVKYIILQ